MARYKEPIPAMFATIHRYPEGEVERINKLLADDHSERVLIHDTALKVLRNAQPWLEKRAEQLGDQRRQNWQPRQVGGGLPPWASRLEAFQWKGRGGVLAQAAETSLLFRDFAAALADPRPTARQDAAERIFRWGGLNRGTWAIEHVDAVIAAATSGVVRKGTPWSSGWTKVAAVATHLTDIEPEAEAYPQVIWDSRVSFAIAELLPEADDRIRNHLSLVPGRGRRDRGNVRAKHLVAAGWRFSSARRAWPTQLWGSRLVHAMAGILNSSAEFEAERRYHRYWSVFDVGAALFVEGY